LKQLAPSPPNSRKLLRTVTFHRILSLTWMRQRCTGKSYHQELISREKKNWAPGFKASKNRLNMLLGGNASGTVKLKPLLVYHSETPRVMRGILRVKSRLQVIWTSNRKAWVTQQIVSEWYSKHFAIMCYNFAIKTICLERFFCCLTTLQVIHQTRKMLSHNSRLR